MINDVVQNLPRILEWICNREGKFRIEDMLLDLKLNPTKENIIMCTEILERNDITFNTTVHGNPSWIAKDFVFNGKLFAIRPTLFELSNNLLIPGSRFDPYVSSLLKTKRLYLVYNGMVLEEHLVPLSLSKIKSYYYLWTEEAILDELRSLSVYNHIKEDDVVTGDRVFYVPAYDVQGYYRQYDFKENDMMIFQVAHWTYKAVELCSKSTESAPEEYMDRWDNLFGQFFYFALYFKPTEYNTLENVLAYLVYLAGGVSFIKNYFIPLQEYLEKKDLLEEATIGVRNIRWVKNADFVPIQKWFPHVLEVKNILSKKNKTDRFFISICSPITNVMIKFFICSFIEENYLNAKESPKEYQKKCVDSFIEDFFPNEEDKIYHKQVECIIKKKYKKYINEYSSFKQRELFLLAFELISYFRLLYKATKRAEKLNLPPSEIGVSLSALINQMMLELDMSLFNAERIIRGKDTENVEGFILTMMCILEKFSTITSDFEKIVRVDFGDK